MMHEGIEGSTGKGSEGKSKHSEGKEGFSAITEQASSTFERIESELREEASRPTTGAALVGGVVVGAAVVFGVAETALGAGAAYFVYRLLRRKAMH